MFYAPECVKHSIITITNPSAKNHKKMYFLWIIIIMVHLCGLGTAFPCRSKRWHECLYTCMVWCICLFGNQRACLFIAHLHKVCDKLQALCVAPNLKEQTACLPITRSEWCPKRAPWVAKNNLLFLECTTFAVALCLLLIILEIYC